MSTPSPTHKARRRAPPHPEAIAFTIDDAQAMAAIFDAAERWWSAFARGDVAPAYPVGPLFGLAKELP